MSASYFRLPVRNRASNSTGICSKGIHMFIFGQIMNKIQVKIITRAQLLLHIKLPQKKE